MDKDLPPITQADYNHANLVDPFDKEVEQYLPQSGKKADYSHLGDLNHKYLVSFEKVCRISKYFRSKGKSVCFFSGCFDVLHTAHLLSFGYFKKHADVLIVAVDSNESVRQFKGSSRPIFDETERATAVSLVKYVDYAYVQAGPWTLDQITQLKPSHLGVSVLDPSRDTKIRKASLLKIKPIITPPFLRTESSSKLSRILYVDYLMNTKMLTMDD